MPSKEAKHGEKQHRHICPTFWAHFTTGRLLRFVTVACAVVTIFVNLEQGVENSAACHDECTNICDRHKTCPLPESQGTTIRGSAEVVPRNAKCKEETTARCQPIFTGTDSLHLLYHNSTNPAREQTKTSPHPRQCDAAGVGAGVIFA